MRFVLNRVEISVAVAQVPDLSLMEHESVSSLSFFRRKTNKLLDELRKQDIVGASTLMKEGVAEWPKAPNVKVRCRRNPTVGSNPTPSAKLVLTLLRKWQGERTN